MAWIDMPEMPATAGRRAVQARAQAGPDAEAPRWYSIRNAADPDEAEVLLYDVIGGWFGIYADEFLAELREITAPKMRVRINSPGGSVFEGIAIANALRAHPATVTVQVDGIAASIASVIAMAGDRVEMAPNSMLMIHEASGVCMGDMAEMTKMAEVLDLISTNIANAYAARSGTDAAGWRDAMRAETWYLADAAVAAGLADGAVRGPRVPERPRGPGRGRQRR
jgi:ATP-dependent protease ClpP protease subunit